MSAVGTAVLPARVRIHTGSGRHRVLDLTAEQQRHHLGTIDDEHVVDDWSLCRCSMPRMSRR